MSEENLKVGIIVPIYNVEKYIRKCLESLKNQTYQDLLIVLVNDGSTDSSFEIAKEYVKMDSRFILIDKINGGQSSARNVALDYFNQTLILKQKEEHYFEVLGENPYGISQIITFAPPPTH